MEQPVAPDGWSVRTDSPCDLQVTIVSVRAVGGRVSLGRSVAAARVLIVVAVLLAAAVVVIEAIPVQHGTRFIPAAEVPSNNLPGVGGVDRYPLGCLGASISGAGATPSLQKTGPCWRYGVYITAILRRVHGAWSIGLEVVDSSCPNVALPAAVRAQLAECLRPPVRPG